MDIEISHLVCVVGDRFSDDNLLLDDSIGSDCESSPSEP